ncbi:zinc finger protein ZAT9-like [Canna indica]|uniref:Zinc finger protein ZAT9-like n=1 Tax=Canna indica TaxID=4628 RepID=A0AAQ3K092_9LILI|nr:zinc finger protein ZAT9-like [Canna indica]
MVGDPPLPSPSWMHRCKVCNKSFASGRSLGGHMRSHVNAAVVGDVDERPQSSYGLRENPKKTWRLSDAGYDDGEKCCVECGTEFSTWRALFGHLKCHPERSQSQSLRPALGVKEQLEKQPNSEITPVPHRRRRSKRMPFTAPCSLSGSDCEREKKDGAISLMMLSRDTRYWSGSRGTVKNSLVLEDRKGSELDDARNEVKKMESDSSNDLDGLGDCSKELGKGRTKKNDLNSLAAAEMGIKLQPVKIDPEVMESSDADESKLVRNHVDDPIPNVGEKRSRFECAACKKTFKSYQALGGHRASHKRMKGCPGINNSGRSSSSSKKTNSSVDPMATEESVVVQSEFSESSFASTKKNKEHECLICGKVFSSGQALGGHKRSHLVTSSDAQGNAASDTVIQEPPLKKAALLDLNLPATAAGDSNSTNGESAELKSWWVEGNLNHEASLGVISN